jgi:hypothetical protein
VEWNSEREAAFSGVKQMLASATRLVHPAQAAKLSLAVDASATHIRACLQQKQAGSLGWEPLGFLENEMSTKNVSELGNLFLTMSSLHIIASDLDVRDSLPMWMRQSLNDVKSYNKVKDLLL